eukprot:jgi/Tetstr1/466357/TSEL_010887.t1
MGIPGLLTLVDPICEKTNLYALARGRRLGIDGYVWMHKLGYHHAQSIVLDKDYEPLAKHFLQQAQSVLGRGVDLSFVFDGAPTPAKRSTDSARQVRRAKAYAAVQYDGAEADPKMLRAAVSLGLPAVVAVLSQLRRAGIPYIVAPFEADAQLSLLARDGKIWAAVTIDSDFIIHGLPRVFFKVNWRSGRCLLYSKAVLQDPDRWPELPSKFKPPQQLLPIVKDAGLPAMLCFGLLDGCDYGTKIRGVGVVKAAEILEDVVKQHGAVALQDVRGAVTLMAQEVLKHLNRRGDFDADAWIPTALNAIDVFQHALAYNPETRKVETVDHMPTICGSLFHYQMNMVRLLSVALPLIRCVVTLPLPTPRWCNNACTARNNQRLALVKPLVCWDAVTPPQDLQPVGNA